MTATYPLPRLLRLMKPFAGLMLLALLFGVLTIGSSVALMATSAWMLSKAALMPSIAELSVAPVLVRAFGVSRGVMRYLERLVSHDVTFRLLSHLRVQFYAALEPLAPAGLSRQRTGDLLARIVGDVDNLQNVYLRGMAPPLVAILVTLGTTALIGFFDGLSALMALAWFIVGMTLLPLLAWVSGRRLGARRVALQAELSALMTERAQGMAELLIYGGGERHQARVEALLAELAAHERRIARWDGLHHALNVIVVQGAGLAVLFVALARVDGVLLATLALATVAAFEAITPLTPAAHALSANLSAARRLFTLMDTPPAVVDTVAVSAVPRDGSLVIRDLTFRYPSDDGTRQPPVFERFNLTVASGERVALLAPSGAGKSTLIHLLARFYDYEAGDIQLGGHDLRAYTQEGARAAIAVMEQRAALFNTTLRENIRIGRPDATDADVEEAARRAEIHNFIQTLPQGYDTLAGEDGVQLSGGQRQRVALARALLRHAPILILDEPTAHLDPATAEAVLTTIFQQAGERTVILLAHQSSPLLERLGVRCVALSSV
jgi:ATP-binding cassette subfamily C protein CydC